MLLVIFNVFVVFQSWSSAATAAAAVTVCAAASCCRSSVSLRLRVFEPGDTDSEAFRQQQIDRARLNTSKCSECQYVGVKWSVMDEAPINTRVHEWNQIHHWCNFTEWRGTRRPAGGWQDTCWTGPVTKQSQVQIPQREQPEARQQLLLPTASHESSSRTQWCPVALNKTFSFILTS